MDFTTIERDIANEIVNIGLSKAADSMSFFTKEKVLIQGHHVEKISFDELSRISNCLPDEILYILTTEIKGELSGVCYLIFTEEETEKLLDISLPESIKQDPDKLQMMGDAIMLEMDNIIVASVVTQFSNFFQYKMYGDVPRLKKDNCEGLKDIVKKENSNLHEFLYFKSSFHNKDLDISPYFLWLLDEKFYDGVRSVAENDEVLKKIRNHNL